MATINDLADHLVYEAGLDASRVRAVVRYLREAHILPASTKGKLAQVETIHAAVLLLAACGSWEQTGAVRSLRNLWALPPQTAETAHPDLFGKRVELSVDEWLRSALSFGRAVEAAISSYADNHDQGDDVLVRLSIPHDALSAVIRQRQSETHYHPTGGKLRIGASRNKQVRTVTEIPWETLHSLGLLVAISRARAAERGTTIEQVSTWRALEPPAQDPETNPVSEPASDDAEPVKTKAARGSSPSDPQTGRQPKLPAPNSAQLTCVSACLATPKPAVGPSTLSKGQTPHAHPREDFGIRPAA